MCLALLLCLTPLAQSQVDTLTILNVNDTHSHLLPYGPKDSDGNWMWGGWARIASLVGMSRMTEPNVMLLHGGDIFVGDFMFQEYLGIAELEIMKALSFDAMALGNHEFDLYPSTLKYVLNEAGFPGNGFPVLCGNLDISGDPEIGYFVTPYTIKDVGSTRVGIIGLLTELTNAMANPSPVVVLPPLSVAQGLVDDLRTNQGCDIVIILSHMGVDYDMMAASSITGIDIIVGGHSHTVIETPIQIGNTIIVQAGEFGRYLGKLSVIIDSGVMQSWNYQLLSVDQPVPAEPNLEAMIGGLAAGVEADPRFGPVYSDVIAQAETELTKPLGTGLCKDNALGNLVADSYRELTGTDIAIQPQGFDSQTIYAGEIKGSDVFQAVPYGFDQTSGLGLKLATFDTDGMSLMAGFEFAVYNLPYVEDFFLHGSNFSYAYNLASDPGARIDYGSITIDGNPIDPSAIYSVTAPDGVIPFLASIPGFYVDNLVVTDYFVYNVVRDFITANSPVSYYSEGRALDLSLLENPENGAAALRDMVWLFRENGSIGDQHVAQKLDHRLDKVIEFLQDGMDTAAYGEMRAFDNQVRTYRKHGDISAWSADKLIYIAGKLTEAIRDFLGQLLVAPSESNVPDGFDLGQNYPNPFNPQTEIAYSLPANSDVRLVVYDMLGQLVAVLVDEGQTAGEKSVVWDGHNGKGENVASGIYFYTLKAGDFSETRSMTLIR